MLDVSVVIPNFNRAGLLQRALDSVAAQTEAPAAIVVVDNGSTDDSVECAKRSGALVIRFQTNQGFARAVNEAAQECKARYIMVLNNDAVLAPECLARLCEAADRSEAAFAAPLVLSEADPNQIDGAWDLLSLSGCSFRAGRGFPLAEPFLSSRTIRFAPFTALLVRTSVFKELNGLNEDLGTYMEDVEFCLRCALTGQSGIYEPQARATHRGSATDGVWSDRMVRQIARNQLLLTAMHWPNPLGFRLAWTVLAGQALWGLSALRHGRALDWLRGKRDAAALYRQLRSLPRLAPPEVLLPLLRDSEAELRSLARGPDWCIYRMLTQSGGA
jgi:GT2 family glycosyltransferase